MTTNSLESNTYWMLIQTAIRAKHDFARLGELYDLSAMQLVTLSFLRPGESLAMNKISLFLSCDASNVTGIVDRLVVRGLIERTECREDRRVKEILLTGKGEHLRRQVIADISATRPDSMTGLTDEEFEQLNDLLKKALLSQAKG